MKVMIREGSSERNLEELIKVITEHGQDSRNFFFCTDDKHPNNIVREGHINYNVRKAIGLGLDPLKAIQLATVNCAKHFRLEDEIGSVSPGKIADVLLARDLRDFKPEIVIASGEIVAKNGKFLGNCPITNGQSGACIRLIGREAKPTDFEVMSNKKVSAVKIIQIIEGQIFNNEIRADLAVKNGKIEVDPNKDVLKIACVERHRRAGNIVVAFVKGFNLKEGVIASSVAHDHHNIVVVDANNADIAEAINAIKRMRGGLVVVSRGKILEKLELPVARLMGTRSPEAVIEKLEKLNEAARTLGCRSVAPFMTLSFISLPTVPELGLTDKGLIDVKRHKIIDVRVTGLR